LQQAADDEDEHREWTIGGSFRFLWA